MSVVDKEIREEQKKALSTMSTKKKFAYFWDYYKIHTLATIAIIAIVFSLVKQLVTSKDYAFYAALINSVATDELTEIWNEEFLEYAQIDPHEYQVYFDTSISLGENADIQYMIVNQQKLLAMMSAGTISVMVADTETFENCAQSEYFYDLRSLLSEAEIEKYEPYFYYTDAATFDQVNDIPIDDETIQNSPADLIIDHRDPSTMENPVAVGIILTENNKIAEAGFYAYLTEAGYEYQGYPSDAVLGVSVTNKEPELSIRFLEYIFE